MDEDLELEFRRFPKEKQEQIRQLVSYCTLMGLTGEDLISIGGKLARNAAKTESKRNIEIAKSYESSITPVGKTALDKLRNEGKRWIYTDPRGNKWEFSTEYYYEVQIKSRATRTIKYFYIDNHIKGPGRHAAKDKICMYNALIALHKGLIQLNF